MKKIDGRTKAARAEKALAMRALRYPQELAPPQTVLQEARALIYGDREHDYGHPKKNLGDIAGFWGMYLRSKYGAQFSLTAEDACQMMVLLKMARSFNGPEKRDTITDMAGYVGLIERVR